NSGKTSFLETLSIGTLQNNPFRKFASEPNTFPLVPNPQSSVTFEVEFSGRELTWWTFTKNIQVAFSVEGPDRDNALKLVREFFVSPSIIVQARYSPSSWVPLSSPAI